MDDIDTTQPAVERRTEPPGLGDLFRELSLEASALVRQEIALAAAEMTRNAQTFGKDARLLVAGGLILYAGFLSLIAAAVLMLTEVAHMAFWASALLIAVLVLVVGGCMAVASLKSLKTAEILPRQTLETLKEDARWATGQKE